MKLIRKISFIFMFAFVITLTFNVNSYAGNQRWNSLEYDVTVNSDGSMDVVETWDISISETNTLFKDFEINDYDDYKINNVKITRLYYNGEVPLEQIYEEQYHVDSGCYYGLQINPSTFEIAWNVDLDSGSDVRIYKMYYTVENAVKIYNDCTEIYWKFLNEENSISGENVTGKIRLPKGVSNPEKLRVWVHGDLNGEIKKISNNEVEFLLNTLNPENMLEIRVVTDENIYENCTNSYDKNMMEKILAEEQVWADKANEERENAKKELEKIKILIYIIIAINILIFCAVISKILKYKEIGRYLKQQYGYKKAELRYFRDIPDEKNATPARAAFLYRFNKKIIAGTNLSDVFSATILDLALKGLIKFEMISKDEIRIYRSYINDDEKIANLAKDEKIIYEILKSSLVGRDYITPEELSNFASEEYELVYGKLSRINDIVEDEQVKNGNISEERRKISEKWTNKQTTYIFLIVALFTLSIVLPSLIIGFILLAYYSGKNASYVSKLTENGDLESARWKGLKQYMINYSLLDEKLLPDLVLWEKYLVYATTFGIAKEVLKQMESVHPEIFDNRNNISRCTYLHMMSNPNFNFDTFNNFSKTLGNTYSKASSAYNIAHSSSSSGSGGGGGFSSGGGGRRRRRKLRRTLMKEIEEI